MYDEFESSNEANATQQIENDKLQLLYAIGCESKAASDNMQTLCGFAGVDFKDLLNFAPSHKPQLFKHP